MKRKYFPHNSVLFCTSRTEQGLPFVCSHNMNLIIKGILAKATTDYDIELCHYIFMGNHFHMIIRVVNPDHVQAFFRYIKTETSHAVNRLLGRRKRTIWVDGYDSPVVLDIEKLKNLVAYLYLNPVKANLVNNIDDYPGVSSWSMLKNQKYIEKHIKVPRDKISKIHNAALSVSEQNELVGRYKISGKSYDLKISPMSCFKALDTNSDITIQSLIDFINQEQDLVLKNRKSNKTMGITRLRRESMNKEHTPKKHTPKMICLSTDKELRMNFIDHFKYLCSIANGVYQKWKKGELRYRIPPGMYAPRVPLLVSAL